MAVSSKRLRALLDRSDMPYVPLPDGSVGVKIDPPSGESSYRNPGGGTGFLVVISAEMRGRLLTAFAPVAYRFGESHHRAAVVEACLQIQGISRGLRYVFLEGGEVRPHVQVLLDDIRPTPALIERLVNVVARGVIRFDTVLRRAMETGEVSFDDLPPDAEALAAFDPDGILAMLLAEIEAETPGEVGGFGTLESIATGGPGSPALDEQAARLAYDRVVGQESN